MRVLYPFEYSRYVKVVSLRNFIEKQNVPQQLDDTPKKFDNKKSSKNLIDVSRVNKPNNLIGKDVVFELKMGPDSFKYYKLCSTGDSDLYSDNFYLHQKNDKELKDYSEKYIKGKVKEANEYKAGPKYGIKTTSCVSLLVDLQ